MPLRQLGDPAPEFSLPGVDGTTSSLDGFAGKPVLVVIFSCNHCPYVQAYEDRLIGIQRDYGNRGVQLVAINSNDDVHYPEDDLDSMMARAKAKGFNFPYLCDRSQRVARAYGAPHTPQIFVFDRDRRLRYTGKIDDNWQRPEAVTRHYLRDALEALLVQREPAEPITHAIGCTIKWAT
ncbi:MAG: thioredoxin family protein [Nitrospirae bacterium]|nr:MAG: thioredoxin family protein [Nitrospirota bacterium]